jgi:phytoene dehydrogenase-like protein
LKFFGSADMVTSLRVVTSACAPEVVIVGGGLSGLACARALHRAGVTFRLYEAGDRVGGRVRTDEVEGFLLDRGFQVMLPAYPEARRVLNYEELDLRRFYRGAEVVSAKQVRRLADPLHHPLDCARSLAQDLMTWRDRWYSLLLRKESFSVRGVSRVGKEVETEDYLREFGFSDGFIDGFFRPFFGGIFLEKDLRTSAAMFQFLFAMFDRSGAALPARGMQIIPDQLAAGLPEGSVCCGRAARSVGPGEVVLADGEVVRAGQVVLATSQVAAETLLPPQWRSGGKVRSRSVTCLYFGAHRRPAEEPILFLDGDGRGPVNNACVLSNVSPHYAPEGQHLISASVLGMPSGEDFEMEVRAQLTRWFGVQVGDWRHLRTYRIQEAQPEDAQLKVGSGPLAARLAPGLFRAGDYCEDVSINGALLSGRRAAEAVLADLGR